MTVVILAIREEVSR